MKVQSVVTTILLLSNLATCAYTLPVDACAYIQNKNCVCLTELSPLVSIRCDLTEKPIQPIFANTSSLAFSLDNLDLSKNHLEDLPLDFLQAVSDVKALTLAGNDLTVVPSALFRLNTVQNLDLSQNLFSVFPVDSLWQLQGLEVLNLTRNQIKDLAGPQSNVELKSLRVLDVSANFIGEISADSFASMSWLVDLDLSHNQLKQVTVRMFPMLKYGLLSLNLSHNQITSIQPLALQHLLHLRVLILSHNYQLADVQDVKFPQHLAYLDLSHCALSNISHCQISTLADLTYIGLEGNDLQCSCQLYLLLTWYQSQHYKNGLWSYSPYNTDWNCTFPEYGADPTSGVATSTSTINTPSTNHSTITEAIHEDANTRTNTSGGDVGKVFVNQLTNCQDNKGHCNPLEHYLHHSKNNSKVEVKLNVVSSGGSIIASWEVTDNGGLLVDGFRLQYMPEDSLPMFSPVLSPEQMSYTMTPEQLEKHYRVCLEVLAYETVNVKEECQMFKDEPANIVVGILAGVIFLVPCVVAMVVILYKDRILNSTEYQKLLENDADSNAIPTEKSNALSTKPKITHMIGHNHEAKREAEKDKDINSQIAQAKCSDPSMNHEGKVEVVCENASVQAPAAKNKPTPPLALSPTPECSPPACNKKPKPPMSSEASTGEHSSLGKDNSAFMNSTEDLQSESTDL